MVFRWDIYGWYHLDMVTGLLSSLVIPFLGLPASSSGCSEEVLLTTSSPYAKQGVLATTVNHTRTLALQHSLNTNVTTAPKDAESSAPLGNPTLPHKPQSPSPAPEPLTDRVTRGRSRVEGNHRQIGSSETRKKTSRVEKEQEVTARGNTEEDGTPDGQGVDRR